MPISCDCVMDDITPTCKSFRSRRSRPSSRSSSTWRKRRSRYYSRIARAPPWWDCCELLHRRAQVGVSYERSRCRYGLARARTLTSKIWQSPHAGTPVQFNLIWVLVPLFISRRYDRLALINYLGIQNRIGKTKLLLEYKGDFVSVTLKNVSRTNTFTVSMRLLRGHANTRYSLPSRNTRTRWSASGAAKISRWCPRISRTLDNHARTRGRTRSIVTRVLREFETHLKSNFRAWMWWRGRTVNSGKYNVYFIFLKIFKICTAFSEPQ